MLNHEISLRSGSTRLNSEFDVFREYYGEWGFVQPRNLVSSSYRASNLDFDYDPVYFPTLLNKTTLYNSLCKGTIEPMIFSERYYVELREILRRLYTYCLVGLNTQLNMDIILNAMDLTKSPGYPLYYKCNTKQQAWDRFKDLIMKDVITYLKGVNITPLWTGTLKDELTHKSKIDKMSTRMFFNGPFWFLIVCNMLWFELLQRLHDSRGKGHPSTIGLELPGFEMVQLLCQFQEWLDYHMEKGATFNPDEGGSGPGPFVFMLDTDRSSYDWTLSPTMVAVCAEVIEDFLPSIREFSWKFEDGHVETVLFRPREVSRRCFNDIFYGWVAVCGSIFPMYGNKSGQLLTGDINSMVQPLTSYPMMRDYMDDPVEMFLDAKHASNGDDGLESFILSKPITLQQFVDGNAKYGTYVTSVSGFTKNAFDMWYLSHKAQRVFLKQFDTDMVICRPREDKLLSALKYKKSKDDCLYVARLYALANGLFGYESRYHVLDVVDSFVSKHPFNRFPTAEWKAATSQRLTDAQLARIHTGLLF